MDQFLCIDCVKEKELNNLILSKGEKAVCSLCKKQNDLVINCNDLELKNLFNTLVRFHYSQWEYDHHLGGEDIRSLFNTENPIFNSWVPVETEDADDLWNLVDELLTYENYDENKSVYIFSDYPYVAIKNDYCKKIDKIGYQIEDKNYYELEKDVIEILAGIISDVNVVVSAGRHYYRARIGYQKKGVPIVGEWSPKPHYLPYKDKLIGRVPPPLAKNGRMNRQGVSFLYVASDSDTALAEVRPHPGQYVSIGKFVSNKSLRIADFTNIKIKNYCSQHKIQDLITLQTINELFSRPVPNQMGGQYLITQLLADAIRKLGYDGVGYKSSVGSGTNLAIFNPSFFKYTEEDTNVVYIKEVKCLYDNCTIMEENKDDYYMFYNYKEY